MEPQGLDLDTLETGQHTEPMVLNLGPAHPCTHGTVRIVVELSGETVDYQGRAEIIEREVAERKKAGRGRQKKDDSDTHPLQPRLL